MMFFGRMGWLLTRTFFMFFVSVIVASVALVSLGFYAPDLSNEMLNAAGGVENWLKDTLLPRAGVPSTVNYWTRWLIDDNQLLFLFFVVIARVLIAMCLAAINGLYKLATGAYTHTHRGARAHAHH